MSNFIQVGGALVDFDRVRAIIPSSATVKSGIGLFVIYENGQEDIIECDNPENIIIALYQKLASNTSL